MTGEKDNDAYWSTGEIQELFDSQFTQIWSSFS